MTKKASYQILTVAFLLVVLVGLSAATLTQLNFSKFDKRYYLTDQQIAFIRPGLNLEVLDVSIGADRAVSVTFKVTDPRGLPLDRTGVYTPGVVAASFILAYIPEGKNQYVAYTTRSVRSPITNVTAIQASADSGGTTTAVGESTGVYKYVFGTKLPEGYNSNLTHAIGIYATRNLTEFGLARDVVNEVIKFTPSGAPVPKIRDVVTTETCNKCHDPLEAHGGSRREVELCILCHTPQTIDPDTGHTQDMPVLIHKIHRGHNLPSVQAGTPYIIIGNQQSVHDYSHVAYPQDIRNCESCHDPEAGAVQHEAFLLRPSRDACGACHDDVNFASGEGHANGLPQISDRFCANCHYPEGEMEFDSSIKGAHTIPFQSTQLPGINLELVDITATGPGENPVVKYRITNHAGNAILPTELGSLTLLVAGPTADYKTLIREPAAADSVASGDAFIYTFKSPIPASATGTFLLAAEANRNVVLNPGTTKQLTQRETAVNPMKYFGVTDAVPVPRRQVVSDEKCDACHGDLTFHGFNRRDPEYCVSCHFPAAQDTAQRPPEALPSRSIDMKFMIHRIHMGHDLTRDYTLYGFGRQPHTYNEIAYPADRANCEKCHLADTYNVPSPGVEATVDVREFYSPISPNSAACLGCHDSLDAAAHTYLNTAPFGESCGACHGPNAHFSVAKVHAR
jgi:OmcA/MtrC family decaheme c-type cytochrome